MSYKTDTVFSAGIRDTVLHMLERAVDSAGDKVFFDVQGATCTYRELDRRATCFAHELVKLGVKKGDTVVTIADTHPDIFTFWFGMQKIGAIWAPINLAYRHEFLRHQITDVGARVVICDDAYLERIVEIADRLPAVEIVLTHGELRDYPACPIRIEPFDDYRGSDETPIPIPVKPQDLAMLIYTSGTTGASKGCMISHNYMAMQGRQNIRAFNPQPGEIMFTPLPMFHSSAINGVLGALQDAERIAVWPRFSLSRFWDDI